MNGTFQTRFQVRAHVHLPSKFGGVHVGQAGLLERDSETIDVARRVMILLGDRPRTETQVISSGLPRGPRRNRATQGAAVADGLGLVEPVPRINLSRDSHAIETMQALSGETSLGVRIQQAKSGPVDDDAVAVGHKVAILNLPRIHNPRPTSNPEIDSSRDFALSPVFLSIQTSLGF
jgi:hypothetical protein